MMHKVGKMPLMEIDRIEKFPDLKTPNFFNFSDKNLRDEDVVKILNYFLERKKLKSYKRGKLDKKYPYIHGSNIPIKLVDDDSDVESGEIDLDAFISLITEEPKNLLVQNKKMLKTSYEDIVTYNTGLPAFRGLVYDEDNKEFIIVNTCTGAGICLADCYAKKGAYVMFPAPNLKPMRVLNYLLNHPEDFERKAYKEVLSKLKKRGYDKKNIYIRWNDSGDFFVNEYFRIAMNITETLRNEGFHNLYSYAHTKNGDVYNQGTDYFIMNFSTNANEIERGKVDLTTAKTSEYVEKDLFDDLFLKNTKNTQYVVDNNEKPIFKDQVNGPNELKRRISKKFNADIKSLLFINELLITPPQEGIFWNAIVLPSGDGDNSAQRSDVRRTFLLHH